MFKSAVNDYMNAVKPDRSVELSFEEEEKKEAKNDSDECRLLNYPFGGSLDGSCMYIFNP